MLRKKQVSHSIWIGILIIGLASLESSLHASEEANSSLSWAIWKNDLQGAQQALRTGADPNIRISSNFAGPYIAKNPRANTALMMAAMCGHEEIARSLLRHGAKPPLKRPLENWENIINRNRHLYNEHFKNAEKKD